VLHAGSVLPSGDSECTCYFVTCVHCRKINILLLWPWSLNFELWPSLFNMRECQGKAENQRLSSSKVIVRPHRQTHTQRTQCSAWTTKMAAKLWLSNSEVGPRIIAKATVTIRWANCSLSWRLHHRSPFCSVSPDPVPSPTWGAHHWTEMGLDVHIS